MNIGPQTTAAIAELNNRPAVGTSRSVPQIKTDPRHPKFNMMQRVREEATGLIHLVLGTPYDQYTIDATGEPAYCITQVPDLLMPDKVMNKIRVISQKVVEQPGVWTAVEELVRKGIFPEIEHVEIQFADGSLARAKPTSDGSEGAVKARGMTSVIAHIDEDCSGNGRPITEIINAAPKSYELGIRDTSTAEQLGYSKGEDGPMFPDKVHADRASY